MGPDRLDLGGSRLQIVLATLLLGANQVVTMDRLLEAVYGEQLPPTSRSQVQICISSLRRLFGGHGYAEIISTRSRGYSIQVESGQLDSLRFEELVASALEARDAGHLDQAVANYREALRLWRGPALDGIDSQLIQAAAGRLEEQRVTATEDRIKLELDLGRQRELVGELTEVVGEYPLRERLRGYLMLALYRCNRTAEALQVYRQARKTMLDELGIEPSESLRQLQLDILRSDPRLEAPAEPAKVQPAAWQIPCLLPTDTADFTGRAKQVDQINQLVIAATEQEAQFAVPVIMIVGKGGIGKTCLAVHACHGIAEHFPDGQLFVDLHGGSPHPVSPVQVLERFLRALGVPGSQIPDSLDERAEIYRGLLARRKILVLLDDAASESQVYPLLPGGPTAAVMITSRRRLAGLAGATAIEVDVFDAGKSLDLLARITGAERVEQQPQAATAIAELCGHLPLALRIAGARLAARPHWTFQQLVDRLADETRRLDELRHADLGIRANMSLTYESTSEEARRLFRRLALLDFPVFSGWVCAPVLDRPSARAEDLLDDLISAQLVETAGTGSGVHSHYRFHDLIGVFAQSAWPPRSRLAIAGRHLSGLSAPCSISRRRHTGVSTGVTTSACRATLRGGRFPARMSTHWSRTPCRGTTASVLRSCRESGRPRRRGSSSCAGIWRSVR